MTETGCRGEFPVDVTEKEYVRAALLASRRYGALHATPAILAVALLCLIGGLCALSWRPTYWLVALVFCIAGPLVALVFFTTEPAAVRKQALRDYAVFREMTAGSRVSLFPDHAQTVTDLVKLTDPYALMAFCLETPELLVFIKDRERLLILPKRCIPPEQQETVLEFLRLTFIRKRRVMRSWLF